ncbi:MAG: ACT domain-containing protein, partial [Clostridia bacterium]|nr:ACT domain-containing protein [Clostridia bacterium]
MKAVITVTGKDSMGIIAGVAGVCAELGANIVDISQSVLQEYFAMIMLADIDKLNVDFAQFVDTLEA